MKREEERMEREKALMNKTSRSYKGADDATSVKEETKSKSKEETKAAEGEE